MSDENLYSNINNNENSTAFWYFGLNSGGKIESAKQVYYYRCLYVYVNDLKMLLLDFDVLKKINGVLDFEVSTRFGVADI